MQFEAKTVEEATKNGLETLGITEEQAKITVIEQPVKGLFGRLKGKAVVEIEKIEESKITLARRIDCIRDVIDDCHEDEGKKITVLDLLEGLGVFN